MVVQPAIICPAKGLWHLWPVALLWFTLVYTSYSECKAICKGEPHLGFDVQIASGAGKLIEHFESRMTARSCQIACCDSDEECTVAVFNQKKMSCSLYSCPTDLSCDLTSRRDHVSYIVDVNYAAVDDLISSVDRGINYKKGSYISDDPVDKDEVKVSAALTRTDKTEADCISDRDCRTNLFGGKCHDGKCACQFNWLNKDGVCHEPCHAGEFECGDSGDITSDESNRIKFSRCVAIYDRCDGIKNCADGSDEINCHSNHANKLPDQKISVDSFENVGDSTTAASISPVNPSLVNSSASDTSVSAIVASGFVDNVKNFFSNQTSVDPDKNIAIVAVILASSIASVAVCVVCCRIVRSRTLAFRRRRLAENVRRHSFHDGKGRRSVKTNSLFSAGAEEEVDSLISSAKSDGNGMFLM